MAPRVHIPDLKTIATVTVSIALSNHLDVPSIQRRGLYSEQPCLSEELTNLAHELPLPSRVIEDIKDCNVRMWMEIHTWVLYLYDYVFLTRREESSLYGLIDNIVWFADGSIDHKNTALRLLDSFRLSEIDKYHVICSYCLKDEMHRVSTLLFTKKILAGVSFNRNPLIYYWNCYFTNNLHKMPPEYLDSLDFYMFQNVDVGNWPAKEYFFDRLTVEKQVQAAILLIDRCEGNYQKLILMKLNASQLLQVYTERAVKIIENYAFLGAPESFLDIFTAWYDVRHLITEEQFEYMFFSLLKSRVCGFILTEIWTSATTVNTHKFLLKENREISENALDSWKQMRDDSFVRTLLRGINANIRQEITLKPFFDEFCKKLIIENDMSILETLLTLWFRKDSELVQFKQRCSITNEFLENHCETLITNSKFKKLNQLFKIWFPNANDLIRFKQCFTSKNFFLGKCQQLMDHEEIDVLEQLLNICLPKDGQFERDLKTRHLIHDYCENLIEQDDLSGLERLLKMCFSDTNELNKLKRNLRGEYVFKKKYEKLIYGSDSKIEILAQLINLCCTDDEESIRFICSIIQEAVSKSLWINLRSLNLLLNTCLPKTIKSEQFMRDSANKSCKLKSRCLESYQNENFEFMNNLLNELLLSRSDFVLEYKQNILMSTEGIEMCVNKFFLLMNESIDDEKNDMFFKRINNLNKIIVDGFPDVVSADELKRKIIFSPAVINRLKNSTFDGEFLTKVKMIVENFITSNEDKRMLKQHLTDFVLQNFREIFYKYSVLDLHSSLMWLLHGEKTIQKFKCQIPIDEIFEKLLRSCIFQTYDKCLQASRCTLKENLDFCSLNRFLIWFLESPKQIKDYKLVKINSFHDVHAIQILLKKNYHSSYLHKLMDWIFENYHTKIAESKKKILRRKNCECGGICSRELF